MRFSGLSTAFSPNSSPHFSWKAADALPLHPLVGQDHAHVGGGQGGRLRVLALLVFLELVVDALVDGLEHLHAALVLQPLTQGGLKGHLLLSGGHGRFGVEHRVDELLVQLVGAACIIQGVIDVGRPVVKGGEEEAQLRGTDDLPRRQVVELVLLGEVAQLRLALLHRIDAADKVREGLVRGVRLKLVITAPWGTSYRSWLISSR